MTQQEIKKALHRVEVITDILSLNLDPKYLDLITELIDLQIALEAESNR